MGREWGVIIDFVDKNGSNLSNVRPPCATASRTSLPPQIFRIRGHCDVTFILTLDKINAQ